MTKKVTKNVKVVEFIEKVCDLHICVEPTDEEVVKIVSALGGCGYQTELVQTKRQRYRHYWCDDNDKPEVETFYILNIYKKITKEVEE